jgi:hypothetical protein
MSHVLAVVKGGGRVVCFQGTTDEVDRQIQNHIGGRPQMVHNAGVPVLQSQYQQPQHQIEPYAMPTINAEGKIIGHDGKEVVRAGVGGSMTPLDPTWSQPDRPAIYGYQGVPAANAHQEEPYVMPTINAEGKIIGHDGKEVVSRHGSPTQFQPSQSSNQYRGASAPSGQHHEEAYAMPTIDWSK